jgi:hypothetical protein
MSVRFGFRPIINYSDRLPNVSSSFTNLTVAKKISIGTNLTMESTPELNKISSTAPLLIEAPESVRIKVGNRVVDFRDFGISGAGFVFIDEGMTLIINSNEVTIDNGTIGLNINDTSFTLFKKTLGHLTEKFKVIFD